MHIPLYTCSFSTCIYLNVQPLRLQVRVLFSRYGGVLIKKKPFWRRFGPLWRPHPGPANLAAPHILGTSPGFPSLSLPFSFFSLFFRFLISLLARPLRSDVVQVSSPLLPSLFLTTGFSSKGGPPLFLLLTPPPPPPPQRISRSSQVSPHAFWRIFPVRASAKSQWPVAFARSGKRSLRLGANPRSAGDSFLYHKKKGKGREREKKEKSHKIYAERHRVSIGFTFFFAFPTLPDVAYKAILNP